jgi:GDP-L-fucose synthase
MSWWTGRRVVVTGGRGFLGSRVMAMVQTKGPGSLTTFGSADYDLRQQADVRRMYSEYRPDVVIHVAGITGGIVTSRDNPGRFFYDNAIMGIEMMEQARHHGVEKYVQIGSVCAYPKYAPVPMREEDLWEGYPEETNGPYGISKKVLLVQSQAYRQQYGLNAIHLLLANLYGPGDRFDETAHVIPALIKRCVKARRDRAESIEVWGTGKASREFLYVDDAARAIVLATELYDDAAPVNIGSAHEVTIRQLVETIAQLTDFRGTLVWDSSKPDGQPRRKLEVERAQKAFGFVSSVSLEEGLRRTIDWYRATAPDTMQVGAAPH